jgi:hypothetical protein
MRATAILTSQAALFYPAPKAQRVRRPPVKESGTCLCRAPFCASHIEEFLCTSSQRRLLLSENVLRRPAVIRLAPSSNAAANTAAEIDPIIQKQSCGE